MGSSRKGQRRSEPPPPHTLWKGKVCRGKTEVWLSEMGFIGGRGLAEYRVQAASKKEAEPSSEQLKT